MSGFRGNYGIRSCVRPGISAIPISQFVSGSGYSGVFRRYCSYSWWNAVIAWARRRGLVVITADMRTIITRFPTPTADHPPAAHPTVAAAAAASPPVARFRRTGSAMPVPPAAGRNRRRRTPAPEFPPRTAPGHRPPPPNLPRSSAPGGMSPSGRQPACGNAGRRRRRRWGKPMSSRR